MHPGEIWDMELWEYNAYTQGYEYCYKQHTVDSILTGYYSAYYSNSGKNSQTPDQLINKLFNPEQSYETGMKNIEKAKETERRIKNG